MNSRHWFRRPTAALLLAACATTAAMFASYPCLAAANEATIRVFAQDKAQQPITKYITGKFCEHLAPTFTREWTPRSSAIRPLPTIRSTMAAVARRRGGVPLRSPRDRPATSAAGPAPGVAGRGTGSACSGPQRRLGLLVAPRRQERVRRGQPRYGAARRPGAAGAGGRAGTRHCPVDFPAPAPCAKVRDRVSGPLGGRERAFSGPLRPRRLAAFRNGNHARAVGPMERASWFAGGRCPVAGRRRLPAGDYGRFAWPVRRRSRTLAARRSHRQGRSGHRAVVEAMWLPLLRWPGGNFVSAYHWQDGVGPTDARPTVPNYAWGGVETNLFGTDEFMDFCAAVGCEPMICVNAGSGTPEEAAQWVQYCNGPVESPMGRRRAAAGHPAPYNVRRWEIGNELWGRWQCRWTTPAGYLDRYERFSPGDARRRPGHSALRLRRPCPVWAAVEPDAHPRCRPLADGHHRSSADRRRVPLQTDPLDVFRDFMAVPDVLDGKWCRLRGDMEAAGIPQPRLAVTELQMFAHLGPAEGDQPARMTRENLVTPATQAEALYDALIYHCALRSAPLVELITHSATVNHGGGLRKERERVYANPCYWLQAGFAAFAGAAGQDRSKFAGRDRSAGLARIAHQPVPRHYPAIDALAAVADDWQPAALDRPSRHFEPDPRGGRAWRISCRGEGGSVRPLGRCSLGGQHPEIARGGQAPGDHRRLP